MNPVTQAFLDGVRSYAYSPSTGTFVNGANTLRVKVHPVRGDWVFTNAAGLTMGQATRDALFGALRLRADGSFFTSEDVLSVLVDEGGGAVSVPFPKNKSAPRRKPKPKRVR